jgi:hypothetical protein
MQKCYFILFFPIQSIRGSRQALEKCAHELVKGVKRQAPVEVQYVTASKLEAPGMIQHII